MGSHDQHVGLDSSGSQQTRLSGFFRNVHSKFSGLLPRVKEDPEAGDVVAASQVVRKKPLLVIGDFSETAAPREAACGDQSGPVGGLPVTTVDSKKEIAAVQIAQTAQQGLVLSKPASEDTVAEYSNGGTTKQPNAGAGTKRKAAESEDEVNKRVDARIREVPFPMKPSIRKELESYSSEEEFRKVKVSVKRLTWEQDSDWIFESSAAPVLDSLEVESAKDVIAQQNRNLVQAPPSGTSILPNDSSSLDDPLRLAEESKISKEGLFNDPSSGFSISTEETDSEKCTTSERRLRKDALLDENWGLPVDLKGDLFCSKLKEILSKPFDSEESAEMWDLVTRRKPVLKLRQTRGRTMQVPSKDEGLSYLDHHPDLAQRIRESYHPAEKLALLRAFFFWLQHSCMEGAFKPWAPETKHRMPEGDCVLTDGPDCEVLAVVLPLDEKNEVGTVVKPLKPVVIDLSDDDNDDCPEVTVISPVKTTFKTNFSEKIATCICCFKEFAMEKDRQRALYRTCGHIETCMQCVDRLWKLDKFNCLKCGVIQSMKPGSLFEFADSAE